MSNVLKDNGTPVPALPTGEQQIIVSASHSLVVHAGIPFSPVKVACRIRPMTEEEILQGGTIIAHKVASDNVSRVRSI